MSLKCKHTFKKVQDWGGKMTLMCTQCHWSKEQVEAHEQMLVLICERMKPRTSALTKVKTVGANLVHTKHIRGRVNWILFDNKANPYQHAFSHGCYGSISQPGQNKTRWLWAHSWRNWNSELTKGLKERRASHYYPSDASKRFSTWVLNDSPWSSMFIRKDFYEVFNEGSLVDGTKANLSFAVQGLMVLRSSHDYPKHMEIWDIFVNAGVDPTIALILFHTFDNNKGKLSWRNGVTSVGLWHSEKMCRRAMFRMRDKDLSIMAAKKPLSEEHAGYESLILSWLTAEEYSSFTPKKKSGLAPIDWSNPIGQKHTTNSEGYMSYPVLKNTSEILGIVNAWSDKNGGLLE